MTTASRTGSASTWRRQEKADVLLRFFNDVGRDNLAINFDPANLILYGTDEPIPALRAVGRYVKSVHCKDAKRKPDVGGGWAGVEVALGQGDVNMELFLRTLKEIGYFGPLTIEREISGDQQKKDIAEPLPPPAASRRDPLIAPEPQRMPASQSTGGPGASRPCSRIRRNGRPNPSTSPLHPWYPQWHLSVWWLGRTQVALEDPRRSCSLGIRLARMTASSITSAG